MKTLFAALLILLTAAQAQQDAQSILNAAKYVTTLNKVDMTGKLKKGRVEIPVKFYLRNKDIQMQYLPSEKAGWSGIHLQLNDNSCDLYDVKGQDMTKFPDDKVGQAISGTDLTYEDLSLRFLYWPNPELVGEGKVKLFDCYIIRVFNPNRSGNYSTCDLWIHKKAAALMQVKAYDWKGKHIKTFKVDSLMQFEGDYVMEKMKVESIKNDRTASISYLIFDDPNEKDRRGPRKLR